MPKRLPLIDQYPLYTLSFNGVDGRVEFPYSLFGAGADWTVLGFLKGTGCLWSTRTPGVYHYFCQDSNRWPFHTDNADGTYDDWDVYFPTGYDTGRWNIIGCQVEKSGSDYIKRILVNGAIMAEKTVSGKTVREWISRFEVGVIVYDGLGTYFNGCIGPFYIYSRALRAYEMSQIICNPLNPPRNGLTVFLPLVEGSGGVAVDHSGYGYNGTLYGGVSWVELARYEIPAAIGW
jgi:hypothetical protein